MTAIEFKNNLVGLENNMMKFALSLTADYTRAEDLVQDTYVKAIIYKDKFEEYTNLKAWVFTIMKNTFINNYRRAVKENTIFDGSQDLYLLNLPKTSDLGLPDSVYSEKEIKRAIDSLVDDFKIPFRKYLEGYKYKEIAEELDLKIGTVKSRIFFTRKKLMEILVDYS